jgi:hypothetical protein
MERERAALTNFLSVHAHKIGGTPRERGVLLVDYSEMGVPLDAPLVFYDVEDLMSRMNRESTLVRFVLHRIHAFDPDKEALVGLIFDADTVLIETLVLPQQ